MPCCAAQIGVAFVEDLTRYDRVDLGSMARAEAILADWETSALDSVARILLL